MSTRANIVVKNGREKLIFYRHSDGYPEGTMPLLEKFLNEVKIGNIRDNVSQSAGWLIEFGRQEMIEQEKQLQKEFGIHFKKDFRPSIFGYGWKVGYIEPTTCIHDDIEYLYTIDLQKKTIKVKSI